MSPNTNAKPKPADIDLLAGTLALEPHLPGPADLPPANELPDDADTVADPAALAARLTGSTALRAQAANMIAAGAPEHHVRAAVQHTEHYTRLVADLLTAVDDVIAHRPGALAKLTYVNCRLAWLEQDRDAD